MTVKAPQRGRGSGNDIWNTTLPSHFTTACRRARHSATRFQTQKAAETLCKYE